MHALHILTVGICYLGFGFLLSRFFQTAHRNNPLLWLFLSIVTVPMYVSLRALFGPVPHIEVLLVSTAAICAGFFVRGKQIFQLLPEERQTQKWVLLAQLLIILLFFLSLFAAKQRLIDGDGSNVIWDDFSKVKVVIATGFDVGSPRTYGNVNAPLAYHHLDYTLAGIMFRLTPLTAQEAWFLHNILEYAAVLSLVLYVGTYLFRTAVAKIGYTLMMTVAGGGLDYFFYRVRNISPPFGISMEFWNRHLGKLNAPGYYFEFWSSFYSFQWAPHHVLSAFIFLFVLVLLAHRKNVANLCLAGCLLGGLMGFSVFVFITGFCSVVGALCLLSMKHLPSIVRHVRKRKLPGHWRQWTVTAFLCLGCFSIFAVPQITRYYAKHPSAEVTVKGLGGRYIYAEPIMLPFTNLSTFFKSVIGKWLPDFVEVAILQTESVFRLLYSAAFILTIDLGLIFIMTVVYFVLVKPKLRDNHAIQTPFILGGILVTGLIIFTHRSLNVNDLFMRGSLVLQFSAVLAAAMLLDRFGKETRRVWLVIPLLLIMNSTNFFHSVGSEIRRPRDRELKPFNAFIIHKTPKDAVMYSAEICRQTNSIYYLNRHCVSRKWEDVKEAVLHGSAPKNAYFVSGEPVYDRLLREVNANDTWHLYQIMQ